MALCPHSAQHCPVPLSSASVRRSFLPGRDGMCKRGRSSLRSDKGASASLRGAILRKQVAARGPRDQRNNGNNCASGNYLIDGVISPSGLAVG